MPVQAVTPRIELPSRRGDAVVPPPTAATIKVSVRELNFFYGRVQALHNITIEIPERIVMAFIGPSGCGKSTFLRTLNRMNDVILDTRVEGQALIVDRGIYAHGTDVLDL